MLHRVVIAAIVCAGTVAAAEPVPLDGAALNQRVKGATVHLDTPLGTSLPVRYSAEGLISGEAGALSWFLGSATDRGRWWIANDKLCHKWFKWFDAEVQCLRIKQDGQHLSWVRDDGKTGTATLIAPEPVGKAPYALGVREDPRTIVSSNVAADTLGETTAKPHDRAAAPPAHAIATETPAAAAKLPVKAASTVPAKPAATPPAAAKTSPPVVIAMATMTPKFPAAAAAKPAAALQLVPTPQGGGFAQVSYRVARVDADDVLNIRRWPSAEAEPIGVIRPDSQGVKLSGECRRDWCPVTHRGLTGWVNRYYLAEEDPASVKAGATRQR